MSTDLISSGIRSRALVFFGLGGSGIRILEPLLHLCALGLGPRQLKVVLIDPDQSNAAVTRSRALLDLYRKTRDAITDRHAPNTGYFRTEVIDAVNSTVLWSPIADDEHLQNATFGARVDRPLMTGGAAPLANLVDLLFAKKLQAMDLALGFRGVPSIGTVFMNRLREESFFEQLLTEAQTDAESVFFATGSIFGGTGAAGLPVVGRALVDGVKRREGGSDVRGVAAARVGAAILLPYFTLPAPATREAPDGGLRPEAALFAQNAAAAMPTYTSGQAGYGGLYMLGDSEPREQDKNEVGGAAQANRAHYVELFAALAALDFASRGGEAPHERMPVFRTIGVDRSNARWSDLPLDDASRQRLLGGFVAAHTFLTIFRPDGSSHPGLEGALRGNTWLSLLGMSSGDLQSHSTGFDLLGEYFSQLWQWVGEMRASSPALELVRANGRKPSDLPLHETIEGRRAAEKVRPTTKDGLEVFRQWNLAAHRHRNTGYAGFLDVMREGSEAFAAERFAETVNA